MDDEVKYGLDSGYTMVTLDCSEYINNGFFIVDEAALTERYGQLTGAERAEIEREYLGCRFAVDGTEIAFDKTGLMRLQLVYGRAIEFMAHIFQDYIESCVRKVDFEVSIDETMGDHVAGGALFYRLPAKEKKSSSKQPCAALYRRISEGNRLHRRPSSV